MAHMEFNFESSITPEQLQALFGGEIVDGKWVVPNPEPEPGPYHFHKRVGNLFYFRNNLNEMEVQLTEKAVKEIGDRLKEGDIIKGNIGGLLQF